MIANHALVMINAARAREDRRSGSSSTRATICSMPRTRLSESHSAGRTRSKCVAGSSGPEGKSRGRRRGLAARLMDVARYDDEGAQALDAAIEAARALPSEGWLQRMVGGLAVRTGRGTARGGPRHGLRASQGAGCRLRARDGAGRAGRCARGCFGEGDGSAGASAEALSALSRRLEAVLEDAPDWLDSQARARVEGAINGLAWRREILSAWIALAGANRRFGGSGVRRLAGDRSGEGREYDVGDPPTLARSHQAAGGRGPSAGAGRARDLCDPARGRRRLGPRGGADRRGAAATEPWTVSRLKARSTMRPAPKSSSSRTSAGRSSRPCGAYARLIEAAGGGTLGLFTAIQRLKTVHSQIADRLARAGLPLLAQHVDPIEPGTLVDIFRDDPKASLLGTDALRDGVDVPGESLRLVVMERVPWPRPTVLHAARRMADGGSAYDDAVVRARLAQAFGRLIRREGDRGTFIILSAAMPSRLLSAFPAGVPIQRVLLDEAIAHVAAAREFGPAAGFGAGEMRTLYVLRHAKSDWGNSSLKDFDRPLNDRGRKAAKAIGKELRKRKITPDLVLTSPAERAKQTLGRVQDAHGASFDVREDQRIYLAEPEVLIDAIRSAPEDAKQLMIVGHNPGLQELVVALATPGELGTRRLRSFRRRPSRKSGSMRKAGGTSRPAAVSSRSSCGRATSNRRRGSGWNSAGLSGGSGLYLED